MKIIIECFDTKKTINVGLVNEFEPKHSTVDTSQHFNTINKNYTKFKLKLN